MKTYYITDINTLDDDNKKIWPNILQGLEYLTHKSIENALQERKKLLNYTTKSNGKSPFKSTVYEITMREVF